MRKFLFLIVLAAFLGSCSRVALTGRKQLSLVPESEVLGMSFKAYKQFIDSVPLSTDQKNVALVKSVGRKIATEVERYLKNNGGQDQVANFAWEFNLVRDTAVNAFCMPGGKVVVFEGILPVTQNENGMAVVMGHEIAHAVAKHSNERISQQMALQYGASLTDLLLSNKSDITRATIGTVYGLGAHFGYMLPYSRKHEHEADQLGLIFLAMAGYDPTQAIAFWERMSAKSGGGAPVEFMSTHPSDANRIAKLKEYLPEALKYYKK